MSDATPQARPYLPRTARFRDGADTPRAFLEECLDAVARLEPTVGAFTVIEAGAARRAADAATARWRDNRPLSPVDGMPVGVKDIIDTADMDTAMGSALFAGHRPRFDAASVQGLRESGCVVLGKTVTTEFASTEPRGTRNPWDTSRTPGGSSSGSAAAVAAGMVAAALGTQVVGSILRPSGYCGVHGFKPGVGGINRGGSLDFLSQSTTGPIAASLADTWAVAAAVAGRVGGDPGYPGLVGPETLPSPVAPRRLALLQGPGWSVVEDAAREALEDALRRLRDAGVTVITAEASPELRALEDALAGTMEIVTGINAWEWRWPLNSFLARDAAAVSEAARRRAAMANAMTQRDYAALLRRRDEARAAHARLSGQCDALVSITAPGAAPVGLQSTGNPVFAAPSSMLGAPALALPLLRAEGLPLGFQLVGFRDGDAELFALANGVEAILGA
ncbi:amidase [Roseomonas elaeocarpi]|uniref:Amidase n=1 Tax=Roseomonas elaeocarpi TaxID=907779 RepID=A0ABV6JQY7_9PROT